MELLTEQMFALERSVMTQPAPDNATLIWKLRRMADLLEGCRPDSFADTRRWTDSISADLALVLAKPA